MMLKDKIMKVNGKPISKKFLKKISTILEKLRAQEIETEAAYQAKHPDRPHKFQPIPNSFSEKCVLCGKINCILS